MRPLTLTAPAKINLSLRVLRRREDGFHDIDTLMTRLPKLADEITINHDDCFSFSCSDPSLGTGSENLVVKAVRAFEKASGINCDCHIHLKKVIPHGAGLGGGSSDAASTLLGLNQWHGQPLDAQTIHQLAASLGSDIPFFLYPGPGRATGRGEIISPAEPHPPLRVLLLKPSFGVATPDAYRCWLDSEQLPGVPYTETEIAGVTLINDLERPTFSKHRFLAEMKCWLLQRPETLAAQLCGSGSTVFAILNEKADAGALTQAAHQELDPTLWTWSGQTD